MPADRTYLCIDMKTFYASVECAERGLNPFETNLVVADLARGKNALCLAISPKMKAQGIHNRCRLSEIPNHILYEVAPPQMQLYIDYAADIYSIYLNYFSPADIHVYSIDEAFLDATSYLRIHGLSPKGLAKKLIDEIAEQLHIPSTAGIGTNLYLAKIALDITAKHSANHMGYLTEALYRETLWDHLPITDFWQISAGTERRLNRNGIFTMRDIAQARPERLYRIFGVNAELLIDHAWGRESCQMDDIKNYRAKSHSVSFSQILPCNYDAAQARIVMTEMILSGAHELMKRKVISRRISLMIGYSYEHSQISTGSTSLISATNAYSLLKGPVLDVFDRIVLPEIPVRRLGIAFENVSDESCQGYDFFTDWDAVERDQKKERAVLEITEKLGKNAVLRGTDLLDGATQRERNTFIGGHRAGSKTGANEPMHVI